MRPAAAGPAAQRMSWAPPPLATCCWCRIIQAADVHTYPLQPAEMCSNTLAGSWRFCFWCHGPNTSKDFAGHKVPRCILRTRVHMQDLQEIYCLFISQSRAGRIFMNTG